MSRPLLDRKERLELFDAATQRQRMRQVGTASRHRPVKDRGWTREQLYDLRLQTRRSSAG